MSIENNKDKLRSMLESLASSISINVSDTYMWGCSDSEQVDIDDFLELQPLFEEYGHVVGLAYVSCLRNFESPDIEKVKNGDIHNSWYPENLRDYSKSWNQELYEKCYKEIYDIANDENGSELHTLRLKIKYRNQEVQDLGSWMINEGVVKNKQELIDKGLIDEKDKDYQVCEWVLIDGTKVYATNYYNAKDKILELKGSK